MVLKALPGLSHLWLVSTSAPPAEKARPGLWGAVADGETEAQAVGFEPSTHSRTHSLFVPGDFWTSALW